MLSGLHLVYQHVEAVAEPLDIDDPVALRQGGLGPAQVARAHLQTLQPQGLAQLGRRAGPMQASVVHEGHAMAPLRLVEIRRCQENRHALARELRERVPELAARDRIDARRRLVEQENAGLGHERAGECQLLLHAAAEPSREPLGEAFHPEHREIAIPALLDLVHRHAPQLPDVAKVLRHAQVRVEAEHLPVDELRPLLERRPWRPIVWQERQVHRTVREIDRPTGRSIADEAQTESCLVEAPRTVEVPGADGDVGLAHRCVGREGHWAPSTRISPSAGMPGFAKPTAPRSRSFTPITCFTRSSRK